MEADLVAQLRRLGIEKGRAALKKKQQRQPRRSIESLLPGRLFTAEDGACFVTEQSFPLTHSHGARALGELPGLATATAARMGEATDLGQLSFSDLLFLDTETTGLSGGAGTIAFLVGVGYFDEEQFTVLQYFLRSPDDEPAMLTALEEQVGRRPGVVSFNGRSFDLPLLENRYILNRKPPPFLDVPHFDLLHPSRRLWRDLLDSCSLVSLERNVLGVVRDQADVPSSVIPLIYRDYLRTGNAVEMPRIFYHNQVDVVSMVTLATRLCTAFERPSVELGHGIEWLSLGRWYEGLGLTAEADRAYRRAIEFDLEEESLRTALFRLGRLLKRAGRREEAAVAWRQLAALEKDGVQGHVELAKYCEWYTRELEQAAEWTRRALSLVGSWPRGRRAKVHHELIHRLARLERKICRKLTRGVRPRQT